MGGGGAADAMGRRAKFLTVAYWNPRVEVGASGEATVSFKLPDNLTTFRVMAVAVARDQFGSGEAEVISSKPFMMRTSLPFFTAVGDTFKAGVVLHNYTDEKLAGTITANAKDIELTGDREQDFSVPPDGHQEIFFSYRAKAQGAATLSFDAAADGKTDGLQLPLAIKITQPKEVFTTYGEATAEAKELFEKPDDVFADFGGLDVDVSSTALVGLTDASLYLMKYRYECTEQKVSKAFGIMTYDAIAEGLGME
ncbi:MAG: hypothetical protein GWN87_01510, partial [Desulfuromonadales bacterium]|nr:hypothetical protein [Desulfuromonadales bacterium]